MSNKILQDLSNEVHTIVHVTPNESHGFDNNDVLAAAVLLHAIVMDVGAVYLSEKVGKAKASQYAYSWGDQLHEQLLKMTGVDTYGKAPITPPSQEAEKGKV